MSRLVLLTAAEEDTECFRSELKENQVALLHYPLERYRVLEDQEEVLDALGQLEEFENIVHGSKRNARFFVKKIKEFDKLEAVRNRLNLALNQHTADYLEKQGIPAIHPQAEGKAINLLEFMLRVRRIGKTLYPCGDKTKEELPGFLQELDIPVKELVLFTLEGPEEVELDNYRKDISAREPEIIIFHSRRSVNRTLAAFPNLNYKKANIISGDQAVTDKLKKEGIEVDIQAEGSWASILKKVAGYFKVDRSKSTG
ncbi:MAG: uroporphyrinogen-III synthase [Balneolaceae bacterium]|jgi:uroporphyrinogen-III synthase